MELWALIQHHLFTPGFAVGVMLGAVAMYSAISRSLVTTPVMADMKAQLSSLQAKLDQTELELTELRAEVKAFIEWRKSLVERSLIIPSTE